MEEVFAGSCQAITNRISIAVAVQIRSTQEDCCSERLSVFSLPFSWMKAWRSITIFERMKRILPTQIGRRYKTSERSRINCMNNCKRTSKKYCFSARGSRFWDLFGWFELVFLINFHYFFHNELMGMMLSQNNFRHMRFAPLSISIRWLSHHLPIEMASFCNDRWIAMM